MIISAVERVYSPAFGRHCLILALLALLVNAQHLRAQPLVFDFEDGTTQGWISQNTSDGRIEVDTAMGAPPSSSSMRATDLQLFSIVVAQGPASLTGDLRRFTVVQWDEFVPPAPNVTENFTHIILRGTDGTEYRSDDSIGSFNTWNAKSVSLTDPNQWRLTANSGPSTLDQVLADVAFFGIEMETHDRTGVESFIDNIRLSAAPVAADDTFSMTQGDPPLNISAPGVLGNDTDADNEPLTAVVVSPPANAATFTFNADGSFIYAPNTGFTGTDTFTYMASDGSLQSNVATVTITVAALVPPTAVDDNFQIQSGQTLSVSAPGVLGNDSDPENDPLTAVLGTGPASAGSFTLNADGSFTYTPLAGFTGNDSFTYTATDGVTTSNTATVTITVVPDPLDCIDLLRVPADAYEALVQSTLAQQLPAIDALLQAGDVAGAAALAQSTSAMLVQEAATAAAAVQTECANCIAVLQANGNQELIPTVNNACVLQTHRIGGLQASAIGQLESAVMPPTPPAVAFVLRDRYLQEMGLVQTRTMASMALVGNRHARSVIRYQLRGNTAAANASVAAGRTVLQRTSTARIRRIEELCQNFVARAAAWPGSGALIEAVTTAANQAMADIQLAESDAMQVVQDALSS